MKIALKKWNIKYLFRYLPLTLDKDYSEEVSRFFFGAFFRGIRDIFIKTKDYRFAILVNNKFAGISALYYFDKERYELGYLILKKFRGKGIATEASKKILKFGFNKLKLKKVIASIDMDNKTSNHLIKKLGFKLKKKDKKDKANIWEKLNPNI